MRYVPLLLLCACQVPFEINRKDLGPFRVAAIGVEGGGARAAVWSGLGLYHEQSPTLEWSLDGAPLGEGYAVVVPGAGRLALVATSPDGLVAEATVTVAEPPPAPTVARAAVGPIDDPSIEARLALDEQPVDAAVPEGQALRLRLSNIEAGYSLHWMSALGMGTTLELSEDAADVLAEELVFDDGVLASRTPVEPGLFHQLALLYDGAGSNRWVWIDGAIGVDGPFARQGERLIPVDSELSPGLWAFDVALEDSVEGIALSNPEAVDDLSAMTLSCGAPGEPFQLHWVAEGRCPRPALDGARVVLEIP